MASPLPVKEAIVAQARVRLIDSGMQALLQDAGVGRELARRAERIAAQARSDAPVASGDYRDSIHVESDLTAPGRKQRRRSRVVAGSDHALVVEAKTGNLARSMHAGGVVAKGSE